MHGLGVCEYLQLAAEPGTLLLFPAWMMQATLPVMRTEIAAAAAAKQESEAESAAQVSVAFTFHAADPEPHGLQKVRIVCLPGSYSNSTCLLLKNSTC